MKLKNIFHFIVFAVIMLTGMTAFQSCSDDDSKGGGQPVITGVRITDPEYADSLFTDAKLGQMIVVVGQNLHNAKKVYINDQEVSFNCNYNTSTHLIVTIPYDLVVYGEDNTLAMEIRIETSHGTATYGFHVIAGKPFIEYYVAELVEQPDGTRSMVPGMDVLIRGGLFHEIEGIYVADRDTVKVAPVTQWELNDSLNELTLKMPEIIPEYGIFVMECYAGTAYCGFTKYPAEPAIFDVIPDMPVPGQTVCVYGENLKDVLSLTLCGEIEIEPTEVTTFESKDRLLFTMPDALPSASSNGKIVVKTFGGRAEAPFYRFDWIFEDFDGHGPGYNWNWGTDFSLSDQYSGSDPNPITVSSGVYALFMGTTRWWDHNLQYNNKHVLEDIPADTPADRIDVRFQAYIHEDIPADRNLCSKITIYSVEKGDIPFTDAVTGVFTPAQWLSISVPLTEFCPGVATYGDFCAMNT
ncbi:MAG: hypothetical protein K2M12_01295, partial [Muribaculaceae bacterium]|nr:hypothetical protein [Muribaculaceae bacterium]